VVLLGQKGGVSRTTDVNIAGSPFWSAEGTGDAGTFCASRGCHARPTAGNRIFAARIATARRAGATLLAWAGGGL
jgi:hypothetical protein